MMSNIPQFKKITRENTVETIQKIRYEIKHIDLIFDYYSNYLIGYKHTLDTLDTGFMEIIPHSKYMDYQNVQMGFIDCLGLIEFIKKDNFEEEGETGYIQNYIKDIIIKVNGKMLEIIKGLSV